MSELDATDTNPPKENTPGNPTFEPTYLTYEPTDPQPGVKTPTFEPTYLTDEPTDPKADLKAVPQTPTFEPTYLTDEPTDPKADLKSPTFEPTYLTYNPTDSPNTGLPTVAPTLTHEPTSLDTTEPPVQALAVTNAPSVEDSVEDSMSATNPDAKDVNKPPNPPPTAKPTDQPVVMPTMKPTNPAGVIKEEKYRNKFVAFQSDWGPAHPGSMSYDFTRNSIYVTGTTFAPMKLEGAESEFQRSTCFLGEMPIADIEEWVVDDPPRPIGANKDFVVPDSMGEREIMGCQAIYESSADERLYVATANEPDATDRNGKINAGLNTYSRDRFAPNWQQNPTTHELHHSEGKVRWPVVMTGANTSAGENAIMVLTVGSDDKLLTEEYIENGDANNAQNSKNTLLPPGLALADPSKYAVPKRGTNFFMMYEMYKLNGNELDMVHAEELHTESAGEIFPTALAKTSSHYLFGGTVKGRTPRRFEAPSPLDSDGNVHLEDYDGFVTGIGFPMTRPSFEKELNVRFDSIETNPHLDDFVHGICMPPPGPKGGHSFYYVVGSSYGTMPAGYSQDAINTNILSGVSGLEDGNKEKRLSAWVSKVDLSRKNDRSVAWTTQLFATNDNISLKGGMTEALGCHVVDQDKTKMYIAGTVYNGGTIDSAQKSAGGDDVWVAQLNSNDGTLRWIKQIGSSGDEKLARTNGIESDLNGHAIIYGETTGELYRRRKGEKIKQNDGSSTDIFVTTLDLDSGASESTIEGDRSANIKRDAIIGSGATAILLLLCIFCGCLMKWRRAKRYAAKDVDGVLKTQNLNSFNDDGETADFASAPPKKAFKDSLSDDGTEDEANGDASGGLSKFV